MSLWVRKRCPPAFQLPAKVAEVVDFAVEDDPNRLVFVASGWRPQATSMIDKRRWPRPADPAAGCTPLGRHRPQPLPVGALAVGAAVAEHVDHPLERRRPPRPCSHRSTRCRRYRTSIGSISRSAPEARRRAYGPPVSRSAGQSIRRRSAVGRFRVRPAAALRAAVGISVWRRDGVALGVAGDGVEISRPGLAIDRCCGT